MGYFGSMNTDDIPDSLNLEAGEYEQVEISKVREFTSKKNKTSIIVSFKDMDPNSKTLGLSFDWFISIPDTEKAAVFFKRNLLSIGVAEDELNEVDFAEVDGKPSEDAEKLIGLTGRLVLVKNGDYTNVKYFRLDQEDVPYSEQEKKDAYKRNAEDAVVLDTPADDFDMDSFLS